MLTLYGYKKCGTSRKAEKALNDMGVKYNFIDITENQPSKGILKKAIKLSGEPIKKFFNTSGGEYKKLNLKDKIKTMTEAEAVELLSGNGRLVKRPLVTDGTKATVGFNEETFMKTWKP